MEEWNNLRHRIAKVAQIIVNNLKSMIRKILQHLFILCLIFIECSLQINCDKNLYKVSLKINVQVEIDNGLKTTNK